MEDFPVLMIDCAFLQSYLVIQKVHCCLFLSNKFDLMYILNKISGAHFILGALSYSIQHIRSKKGISFYYYYDITLLSTLESLTTQYLPQNALSSSKLF